MTKAKVKKRIEEESVNRSNSNTSNYTNYFSKLVEKMEEKKKEEERIKAKNRERYRMIKNKYTGISLFKSIAAKASNTDRNNGKAPHSANPRMSETQSPGLSSLFGRKQRLGNAFLTAFEGLQVNHRKKKDDNMRGSNHIY